MISEHASPLAALGGVDSGGQNVYVAQLARQLGRIGHEVDVFTRRDSSELPPVVAMAPNVRVIQVRAGPANNIPKEQLLPHMPAFTREMLRWADGDAYDLVHANFFMSGLVGAELKARLGLPLVVTFHALGRVRRMHQGAADGFPEERIEIEERVVREADRIIAECPQDEADLIQQYDAEPSRVSIVPCGFDRSELWPMSKALARYSLGLPSEEPLLLQLGRMVPRKGVDTAIRALAPLRDRHGISARLLVVGGASDEPDPRLTPEIGRLQEVAAEAGVGDQVTFVGRRGRGRLRYYYSAADAFITTPWYEPFGITPLESMACGTPVIGSNVGGIKFSVRDGETGYLVPPRDPDAVADRAAQLFRYPKLRAVFGRQAITRVNDLFTWERVAGQIASVYGRVLDETRSPSAAPVLLERADTSMGQAAAR